MVSSRAVLVPVLLLTVGCLGRPGALAEPDAGLLDLADGGVTDAGPDRSFDAGIVRSFDAGWPGWRTRMAKPNTLYDISDNTLGELHFFDAGAQIPTQFANADDGFAGSGGGILGYGGGVLFRDRGPFGVIAFGSGGHNFAGNYTGALDLNRDLAHYEIFQPPLYADHPTPGAEFYWSPTDAAALPAKNQFPHVAFDATKFDGTYPVAIGGWVYPGPVKYLETATNVPTGQYRYDQHFYIPKQFTGLGTGVWFIPANLFITPGFIYGIDGALCSDFWPGGGKKFYSHYQREDTKAWGRTASAIPAGMSPGGFYPGFFGGSAGFSEKHKLVFVPAGSSNEAAVFDLSNGLEQGTWAWRSCALKSQWRGHALGKSAMSNGHPRNRAFYVWYGVDNTINVVDLDDPTYPLYAVPLPGLLAGPSNLGERAGLHYVPRLDRFVAFGISGSTAYCQKLKVPDDLSDFASYQLETVALEAAPGVDLSGAYTPSGLVQYVESLDAFVVLSRGSPAKAFRVE